MTYIKDFDECTYIDHPNYLYNRCVDMDKNDSSGSFRVEEFEKIKNLPKMIAIGWLDSEYEYVKGNVSEEVIRKIKYLIDKPWGYGGGAFCGYHTCNICPPHNPHNSNRIVNKEDRLAFIKNYVKKQPVKLEMGGLNIYVPVNNDFLYVFPELILHYIKEHNYCPPEEFQKAVLDCPEPLSQEYFNKLNIPEEYVVQLEKQKRNIEWEKKQKQEEISEIGNIKYLLKTFKDFIAK